MPAYLRFELKTCVCAGVLRDSELMLFTIWLPAFTRSGLLGCEVLRLAKLPHDRAFIHSFASENVKGDCHVLSSLLILKAEELYANCRRERER